MDDDNGERVVQTLSAVFPHHGICIAVIERSPRSNFAAGISDMMHQGAKTSNTIMESKANVFVVFGQSYSVNDLRWLAHLSEGHGQIKGKVWILSAQMELVSMVYQRTWDADILHGVLSFTAHSNHLPKFQKFIENRYPSNTKEDGFILDFWHNAFSCAFKDGGVCTGKEKLESLPGSVFEMSMTSHSYSTYCAVYAVAHALHAMHSLHSKHKTVMYRKGTEQWRIAPVASDVVIFTMNAFASKFKRIH
ncbi:UNVERIFIED_CONTAM: hypothetical protein K2H54_032280 [Gekko kuhli]